MDSFMLIALLVLPLAAAFVVACLGPGRGQLIRWISLGTTCCMLVIVLVLTAHLWVIQQERNRNGTPAGSPTFLPEFVPGAPAEFKDAQGTHSDKHGTSWDILPLGSGAIQFYIGLDGLNIWLVVLTVVLSIPAVLISWTHVTERVNEFYAWLLALQTAMMGIFLSFDIVLFYVFFELSLVPLFFLIGIWGGPERRYAAVKFFLFTLVGSMITLLGVIGIVLACWKESGQLTFSLPRLVEIVHDRLEFARKNEETLAYWQAVQFWVFTALTVGFAVKVPLVPFHTWLPLAHVEAPTAGSVDLAGVLLKVGAYGFLRLCLPLAPDTSLALGLPLVSALAALGILYGAFCAYSQDDVKKLVAYSSVSHLGLCMLGMFALNPAGISGSLLQMINHGLSTGGLFLLVGMLYERYHTRKISEFGGMARKMPLFGVFMVFIVLTSVGMPGLNGFIGEVLCLLGIFEQEYAAHEWPIYAVIGALGMVLGAWYLFTMLQRLLFGAVKEPIVQGGHDSHGPKGDLNHRELAIVIPIGILCIVLGVHPQPFLDTVKPDVDIVARIATLARGRQEPAKGKDQDKAPADKKPVAQN